MENSDVTATEERISQLVDVNRLRKLLEGRLETHLSRNDNGQEVKELRGKIADVEQKIENLKDSLEQGVTIKFVSNRLETFDVEHTRLIEDLKQLQSRQVSCESVEEIAQKLMMNSAAAIEKLRSKNPQLIKDGLRVLIDRVEVDPHRRAATFFVNQLPSTAKTYVPDLPVSLCRRSGRVPNWQNSLWVFSYRF